MSRSQIVPIPSARVARSKRQRVRQALLFVSLLLFPVTLYYFSPYLVVDGAVQGIVSGSALVFLAMTLSALFLGRSWCAWGCPAGALQESAFRINPRPFTKKALDLLKWTIWVPWISLIVYLFVAAGGVQAVDPFHNLESGITLLQPHWFIIYFSILALFGGLAVWLGRRAACHTVCWMAPFMIIGDKLSKTLKLPRLHLRSEPGKCVQCKACTQNCPMSLPVHQMVEQGDMGNSECILCTTCVDGCSKGAIELRFGKK